MSHSSLALGIFTFVWLLGESWAHEQLLGPPQTSWLSLKPLQLFYHALSFPKNKWSAGSCVCGVENRVDVWEEKSEVSKTISVTCIFIYVLYLCMRREVIFFIFCSSPKLIKHLFSALSPWPEPKLLVALVLLQEVFCPYRGTHWEGPRHTGTQYSECSLWNLGLCADKVGKLQFSDFPSWKKGIAWENWKWRRRKWSSCLVSCQRCFTHLSGSEGFVRMISLLAFWLFISSCPFSSLHPWPELEWIPFPESLGKVQPRSGAQL